MNKNKIKDLINDVSYNYGVNFERNCPFEDFGSDEETYYMKSFSGFYEDILKELNIPVKSVITKEKSDGVYDLIVNDNEYKIKSGDTLENVIETIKDINSDIETDISKKHESIVNDIMKYEKDFHTYEFNDCYDNQEEAINDINSHLEEIEGVDNLIATFGEDIIQTATEKGLSNKEMRDYSDSAYNLITRLSEYKEYLNKDKEQEMAL